MTLYDNLLSAGCEMDSHESDLYVKRTEKAEVLLRASEEWPTVRTFVSPLDKQLWFEVPFAYAPWWKAREVK